MKKEEIIIYTDGSSLGNPGPGGYGAIIVFPDGKVVELGGREEHTTNNQMELTAAIVALEYVGGAKAKIVLYTDSSYVVNGITKWVFGWVKNGWMKKDKTPVLNKELWEKLLLLVKQEEIRWVHVSGHSGLAGNERADEIATGFAENKDVKLYRGPLDGYAVGIKNVSYNKAMKDSRAVTRTRARRQAHSYVSCVDGEVKVHKTWEECKQRVSGVAHAKFRKVVSAEEERELVRKWRR